MIHVILIVLVIMDGALLWSLFNLNKRQDAQKNMLDELSEERDILREMRQSVREDLGTFRDKSKETTEKITQLAAEVDQEIKNSSSVIAASMEDVVKKVYDQLDSPLADLAKKQQATDFLLRRLEKEKLALGKLCVRAEKLSQFFNDKIPYEEVLKDIEYKKYQDARELITKGFTSEQIARELAMSLKEVELVRDLAV